MAKLGHSILHWIRSLNSVDVVGKNRLHQFVLSARLGLWPAILLSSFAFGKLLGSEIVTVFVLSVVLCLIGSIAFIFNDACDRRIDESNKIHRWHIQTTYDLCLFIASLGLCLLAIILASHWVSVSILTGLVLTLGVGIAYSIFCKKIFLLGNVVAALLSISPGLILVFDSYASGQLDTRISAAAIFLGAAFLLLVSREIKFDEFDLTGDRIGGRATVPMYIRSGTVRTLHAFLCSTALLLLFLVLALFGKLPWAASLSLAAITCAVSAGLITVAYRGTSKEKFYKTTRLVMLVVPLSMLLSF